MISTFCCSVSSAESLMMFSITLETNWLILWFWNFSTLVFGMMRFLEGQRTISTKYQIFSFLEGLFPSDFFVSGGRCDVIGCGVEIVVQWVGLFCFFCCYFLFEGTSFDKAFGVGCWIVRNWRKSVKEDLSPHIQRFDETVRSSIDATQCDYRFAIKLKNYFLQNIYFLFFSARKKKNAAKYQLVTGKSCC